MKYFNSIATHPCRALIALLAFYLPIASAQSSYNNIAFHPVPLSNSNPNITYDPGILFPAGSDDIASQTSVQNYLENIKELEANSGPFSMHVAQQTESLGDLLSRLKDFEGAIQAYEKSMHIKRINDGLYSDEQTALLNKLINSHLQTANYERAHELQQSKLYLKQRIFSKGESGYISALLEWADWNVDLLISDDKPMRSEIEAPGASINNFLVTAQENYIEVIELIQASDQVNDERLIHAEKKLAAINYIANSMTKLSQPLATMGMNNDRNNFLATQNRREDKAEMAYFFNGSSALKRAIAYSLESPEPDFISIAEQMMALGDWYLLFDRRTAALKIYEDAFEVLDAVGANHQDIEKVMTPGMPVNAPALVSNNTDTTVYNGYIDIEFKVSKFGIATRPEVIATSEEETSPVTRALIRKIRNEKFRPAFIDGSASSNENVKLRYYYSYN